MLKAVCVEAVSQKSIVSFSVKYDLCLLGEVALPSFSVISELTQRDWRGKKTANLV